MDENNPPEDGLNETRRSLLKSSGAFALIGSSASTARADDEEVSSTSPPDNSSKQEVGISTDTSPTVTITGASDRRALVIRDCRPWYTSANTGVLRAKNIPTDVINSTELSTTSLTDYSDVIIPSTQSQRYYTNLVDNRNKLDSFVEGGGTLRAHVADKGYPCTTTWSESFLPKGVTHVFNTEDNLSTVEEGHPVVNGISNFDNWGSSAHGYLVDLPNDATVVNGFAVNPTAYPTYAEYEHGEGSVLVTTQTIEWPFYRDRGTREFLRNEIEYDPSGGQNGRVRLNSLLKNKRANSITPIRNNAPDKYLRPEQSVDAAAERFVDDTTIGLATGRINDSIDEYTEATRRLISAERVTQRASADDLINYIERTSDALIQTAVAALSELIPVSGSKLVKSAKSGLLKEIAQEAKGIKNSLIRSGSLAQKTSDEMAEQYSGHREELWEIVEEIPEAERKELQEKLLINGDEKLKSLELNAYSAWLQGSSKVVEDTTSVGGDLRDAFNSFKKGFEQTAFQFYWFSDISSITDAVNTDLFERVDIPDKVNFKFDVPNFESPLIDDDIDVTFKIPDGARNSIVSRIENFQRAFNDMEGYKSVVDDVLDNSSSIESTLAEGTSKMENRIEDGELEEQNPNQRSAMANKGWELIDTFTDITDIMVKGYSVLNKILFYGTVLLTITLFGLIVAAGVSTGGLGGVPAIIGSLITFLGYLGVAGIIINASKFLILGLGLGATMYGHYSTAGSILATPLTEVDLS